MTSLSDRPFRDAARRSLIAAAERLEAMPVGGNVRPRLNDAHIETLARILRPTGAIRVVDPHRLAWHLRYEASREDIPADVLNLAAAAAPEDR